MDNSNIKIHILTVEEKPDSNSRELSFPSYFLNNSLVAFK